MKIAYLVGRYPAVSHTFIQREVAALRERGLEIDTVSIHAVGADQLLTETDRREHSTTYSVLPPRWAGLLRAHLEAAIRSPRRYLAALALAFRLSPPGLRGRLWQLFYFAEAMVVWRRCRSREIRHLHAHFTNQVTDVGLLVTEYMRGAEPPWSWSFTVHGPDEFYEITRFNLAPKVERADFVVCISDFARSQLMALVPEEQWDKLHVVHCGIDTGVFTPSSETEGGTGLRILCIGRLVPVKGQAMLIEAIPRLLEEGVDARATIVGDGPTRGRLEVLSDRLGVADRIRFTGAVGQDAIRDHYDAADAFCLPSFAEGVPVSLMEAMAMEVPVVTSRIMGIPELIEDGVSGLLIAPGNRDQLVRALARLATDPRERQRLGKAGRRKVAADYSLSASADQLHTLFSSQTDQPSS